MLLRQTFQKISAKKVGNWQNRSSNIRKCDKIWSPGYVISSLEKAAQSFLGNFPAFFAQSLKKTIESFSFVTLFFFKMFLCANRTEVWHCCRFFCRKTKTFSLQLGKSLKNTSLFERTFLLSKLSSTLEERSFTRLSKTSVLKVGNWQNGHRTSRNVITYKPLDM